MTNTVRTNEKRFYKMIRVRRECSTDLRYAAYLTDRLTGCKFSNTWPTREQAERWLEDSIGTLIEARPNN